MSFNPALTAIGLGGFFIVLSTRSAIYALLGAVLSIWLMTTSVLPSAPMEVP